MKSVTFDNGRGFALGYDEAAPSPFVTWQFTETENGQRDYYWGHYHSNGPVSYTHLANDAKQWVEAIQEYANITELDAATLNRLIKEIVVHERIDEMCIRDRI